MMQGPSETSQPRMEIKFWDLQLENYLFHQALWLGPNIIRISVQKTENRENIPKLILNRSPNTTYLKQEVVRRGKPT